jgi:hypothetical protein
MGHLYGRAGRLTAENGGFRPGQCRRKGIRVFAVDPLGGPEVRHAECNHARRCEGIGPGLMAAARRQAGPTVQAAAAAACEPEVVASAVASAVYHEGVACCLAWSVAREVIALPAAAEGPPAVDLLPLAAALPAHPFPLAAREALDKLAPSNGTTVDYGPGTPSLQPIYATYQLSGPLPFLQPPAPPASQAVTTRWMGREVGATKPPRGPVPGVATSPRRPKSGILSVRMRTRPTAAMREPPLGHQVLKAAGSNWDKTEQ